MERILYVSAILTMLAVPAYAQDDRSGAGDRDYGGGGGGAGGCCNAQVGAAANWSGGHDDLGGGGYSPDTNGGTSVGGDMGDAATAGGNY